MWYDGTVLSPETSNHRKASMPPLPLIDGNEKVRELRTLEDQDQLTTLLTERAVSFIRKNKDKPFFVYIPHPMPHTPLAVSSKFKGKSELGIYGDVMMEIDWSVGQIMLTLKELNLDENTLVIFTSDNGPWLNFGDHAGSAAGLREGKMSTWEGGQRLPCIMRWKGKIKEGQICNQLVSTIDILPTLAAICDAPLPPRKIDGVNVWSLISGATDVSPRRYFLYYYDGNNLKAVRNERWKLVFPHTYGSYENQTPGKNGEPGGKGQKKVTELELYDLRRDQGERYNVINEFPEVVAELSKVAEEARDDLGDGLTSREGKGRRPSGKVN
jgi:arylsulfatase